MIRFFGISGDPLQLLPHHVPPMIEKLEYLFNVYIIDIISHNIGYFFRFYLTIG